MVTNNDSPELRHLVEEYMIAVELRQQDRVSQLALTIRSNLLELLDDDLNDLNDSLDDDNELSNGYDSPNKTFALEIDVIGGICNRLKDQGHIAAIYDNVIEFVQLRDLICLSKLLGAVPETTNSQVGGYASSAIDFDLMAKILRQSIQLLKFINSIGSKVGGVKNLHLIDKNCLERQASIGFPKYFIDTTKALIIKEMDGSNLESKLNSLINTKSTMNDSSLGSLRVVNLMQSDWFMQFLQRTLMEPYPVDRFIVLVAIWQIGVDCRHRTLEQLMGELVDQVYHEEANSSSIEDLMLLTQVGSIWLSYHKRHQTTMKQANKQRTEIDDDDDDGDDDEDNNSSINSENVHSDESSSLEIGTGNEINRSQVKTPVGISTGAAPSNQLADLRTKLRHLIDDELLHGSQCQICGHQPNELLEPIKVDSSCSVCGLNLSGVSSYCAISHRRLEILDLSSVLPLFANYSAISNQQSQETFVKMVLLSPSEWIRELLISDKCCGGKNVSSDEDEDDDEMGDNKFGEQVDISEKFERLTMIRSKGKRKLGKNRNYNSKPSGQPSDEDETDPDSLDTSGSSEEEDDDDDDETGSVSARDRNDDYTCVLRNFMKVRRNYLSLPPPGQNLRLNPSTSTFSSSSSSSSPSESLMLIKFLKKQTNQQQPQKPQWLPICSSDLLLLDTCGASFVRLGLVESNRNLYADGSIWHCSSRSRSSGLLLGCDRKFCSLELIRLVGKGSSTSAVAKTTTTTTTTLSACLGEERFNCPTCGQHLYKIRTLAKTLEA